MLRVNIALAVLLAGPLHAEPATWLQERTRNMHRVTGRFVSIDYGFSIEALPEAAEYVTDGGDANHGPILILGDGREIDVYPQYTGITDGDAKPCRRHQFPWEPSSTRHATIISLHRGVACMVTFTRGDAIWRVVQTAGNDRRTGIIYTLILTTTARWAREDLRSFRRVQDSFKHVRIAP